MIVLTKLRSILNRRVLSGWIYLIATGLGGALIVGASSRYLPPEAAGTWFTLQSLFAFAVLAEFGTQIAGARQIAYSFAAHLRDHERIGAAYFIDTRTGLAGVSDIMALLGYLRRYTLSLCAILCGALALALEFNHLTSDAMKNTAMLSWLFMFAAALAQVDGFRYQSALEGVGRVAQERVVAATISMVTSLAIVAAILLSHSIIIMAMTWAIGMLATRFGLKRTFENSIGSLPAAAIDCERSASSMLQVSGKIWLLSVGATATRWAQVPIISLMLGLENLPGYYLSLKILNITSTSLGVFVQADRALFTQDLAMGNYFPAKARLRRCIFLILSGSIVLGIAFAASGHWLITNWLRNPEAITPETVYILAVDTSLTTFCGLFGQFIIATGRNPFIPTTLASGAINVILLVILLPSFGLSGAAISSLCAGLLTNYPYNIYQGWKLWKSLDAHISV